MKLRKSHNRLLILSLHNEKIIFEHHTQYNI